MCHEVRNPDETLSLLACAHAFHQGCYLDLYVRSTAVDYSVCQTQSGSGLVDDRLRHVFTDGFICLTTVVTRHPL